MRVLCYEKCVVRVRREFSENVNLINWLVKKVITIVFTLKKKSVFNIKKKKKHMYNVLRENLTIHY